MPRTLDHLFLCGCSHHQAPPSKIRKWVERKGEILAQLLRMQSEDRIAGAVLLATCNRIEILIDGGPTDAASERALTDEILPPQDGVDPLVLSGDEVTRHLLSVAAGLDSMAAGEDQISGQLQRAFRDSEEHRLMSTNLRALRSRILPAAREIRRRVNLPQERVSLAAVAARHLAGTGGRLAVVGTGDTGRRAAEVLMEQGVTDLLLVNRTRDRAERLAEHLGCEAMSLADFTANPPECAGLLLAVHSQKPLVAPGQVKGLKRVVDLSMPSVVDPAMRDEPSTEVVDLDDLAALAERDAEKRAASLAAARELVRAQAERIHERNDPRLRVLGDVVHRHVANALEVVEEELHKKLRHLDEEDRERVRQLVLRAAKRNAHFHIDDLKQAISK